MGEISKVFTSQLFEAIYQVEEDQAEQRLDQFCAIIFPSFSRQQIKKKIAAGEVKIFDRPFPHKASVKVHGGEKIKFTTPRGVLEDEYWRGEKLKLELDPAIIFEDDDIVAISKPSYMATHPTGKHLFNCATVFLQEKYGHTIHSIHRIDRETSGVLLLAKNPKAAGLCTAFFEDDLVSKCYFFIAHKNYHKNLTFPFTAKERMGSLDDYIPRLYVHCFPEESTQGKRAQTSFELIYSDENYILGLAFPKTGRQHQIRAHAAHYGFTLVGDKLYNGDPKIFMRFKDDIATDADHDTMQLSRHALHARALKLPYPNKENNDSLFQAPIPSDLINWIKQHMPSTKMREVEAKIQTIIENFFKKDK